MIQWAEQTPDFQVLPAAELFAELPFSVAIAMARLASPADVLLRPGVKEQIYAHLRRRSIEMGGLLIGRVFERARATRAVAIEDAIASEEFDGTGVSLRMGTDVWEKARAQSTAGQSVVGWYHSHPNLGAFFSGTDRRTQSSFFNQPHSLGLVVDPIRIEERWFRGPESQEIARARVVDL